jgi:hypothetical protein
MVFSEEKKFKGGECKKYRKNRYCIIERMRSI